MFWNLRGISASCLADKFSSSDLSSCNRPMLL
jgi:hypothetical protein